MQCHCSAPHPLLHLTVRDALARVSLAADNGTCRGLSPTVYPQYGGSQLFVYHGDAVATWRTYVASTALASLVPAADQVRARARTAHARARWAAGAGSRVLTWRSAPCLLRAQDKFVGLWNSIAGQQLAATLTYLSPANNVGLFPVTVNVVPSVRPPGRGH